jgi:methylenetetrahydrofolate dehydrogenase (NADP+)/methenyltetrahydrofolate cyclohydrolase
LPANKDNFNEEHNNMAAQILDGKVLSEEIRNRVKERVESLKARGVTPGLAVILVGDDPASEIYVRNKGKGCEETGMLSRTIRMGAETTQEELESEIDRLNRDADIHGILVQLPLPRHLDEQAALARILPEKDVDGFHLVNAGHLMTGTEGVVPCTPKGALYMIKSTGEELSGKEAVVIGRSNIVGKPMAMLLMRENCTVTVCHSRTADLASHTRRADILVAAVGKAGFVTADMVKPGAIVIDVGINRVEGKVRGDVDFEQVKDVAGWITPVPGGVGKMTIAMLLSNTVDAAERTLERA